MAALIISLGIGLGTLLRLYAEPVAVIKPPEHPGTIMGLVLPRQRAADNQQVIAPEAKLTRRLNHAID